MLRRENHIVWKWVWQQAGRVKTDVLFLLLVQMLSGCCGVGYALILRRTIDWAVKGDKRGFCDSVVAFALVIAVQLLLRAYSRFLEEHGKSAMENCLKEKLFSNLLYADYRRVTAVHSGEWMNRLTSDTVVVAEGVVQILPGMAGMLTRLTGAAAAILWMEPKLGALLIPGGGLLLVLSYAFRKVLKRLHKQIQETDGRVRMLLQETLASLIVVHSFSAQPQSIEEAANRMKEHRRARMRRNHFSNLCNVGFGGVMYGTYVLGVAYCGYGLLQGAISYGTLMAVLQLINQAQSPLANITGYLPKYYAMLASAERLAEVEDYAAVRKAPVLPAETVRRFYREQLQAIVLERVSFRYEETSAVLSEYSIEIRKGEYVALLGPSGCGKSTLLKLLLCLLEPDEGSRYMRAKEGAQALSIPLTASWSRLFAYVPQGNFLMSGTIRSIVSLSAPAEKNNDNRLWEALQIACADSFLKETAPGLDTVLGEHGMGLSEGQMQRIAIARAVFADAPVLILDEATSALDEATEEQLLRNLRTMTDKTVLIVTHRQAALGICDRVLELV